MRRLLRSVLVGLICGLVVLGTAWAVVGTVDPTGLGGGGDASDDPTAPAVEDAKAAAKTPALPAVAPPPGQRLPAGQFLAGGAKVSIAPNPATWLPNTDGTCGDDTTTYAQAPARRSEGPKQCLATFDHRWATEVDERGIWARATAIGNGETTVVFAVMDTVGWFAGYPADVCAGCGADAIRAVVAERTKSRGVKAENIVLGSSHTHAAPDTLSQTPTWYYEQVRDAVTDAMVNAVEAMKPVLLETGAAPAKAFNTDRRIVTRAVPDYELNWIRAFRPGSKRKKIPDETVATIANFAAHPTVRTANAELHSGFVGPLTETLEEHFGGTALWAPGGLGDQTVDRRFGHHTEEEGMDHLGEGMAKIVIEDSTRGHRLTTNDIVAVREEVQIPAENNFMLAGRGAGLFVRDLLPPYSAPGGPAAPQKGGARRPTCVTVADMNVVSSITGIRIGAAPGPAADDQGDNVTIITAPGEIFASIAVTTKDYLAKTRNVMIFAMANDTVGYLIPYEQYDETAAQGAGFANNATDLGNYEEALSLGRCAGDTVQNKMLEVGAALGVMGSGEGP